MDSTICMLVALAHHGTLLRCALRVDNSQVPSDFHQHYMEYVDLIASFLPLHVRNAGPIVEVNFIFEIADARPVKCSVCNGDGYSRKSSLGDEPCEKCQGMGEVAAVQASTNKGSE